MRRRLLPPPARALRVVADTPTTHRLPRADVESLLSLAGREVVVLMRGGLLVFARVVGRCRITRWGCSAVERVDLADVVSVTTSGGVRWQAMRHICEAQRRGSPILRDGQRSALIEQRREARP